MMLSQLNRTKVAVKRIYGQSTKFSNLFTHNKQQSHFAAYNQPIVCYYATDYKNLRVGINGGSIAGLTAALTIKNTPTAHNNKVTVQVFDGQKRDDFHKSQGVILTNAAMNIFQQLGVSKQIEASGRILQEHIVRNFKRDTDIARVNFTPAVSIRKNLLLDILHQAVQQQHQAGSKSNANTVSYSKNESMKYLKRMDDGTFQVSQLSNFGKRTFDVLVGAEDSPDSLVRDTFFTDLDSQEGFGVETIMSIIDCPTQLDPDNKIVEWWGKQNRMGCFMINERQLCIYSSVKAPEIGRDLAGLAVLRQFFMIHRQFKSQGTEILLNEIDRIQNEYMSKAKRPELLSPLYATTITKRGYKLQKATDGKNVVLIGDAGYAVNNSLLMDSTIHTLTGFELGNQLCQMNPSRNPQEALNIYSSKSQELIKRFEDEADRYSKHFLTSMPLFLRNLRLVTYKPIGLGPTASVKNSHKYPK